MNLWDVLGYIIGGLICFIALVTGVMPIVFEEYDNFKKNKNMKKRNKKETLRLYFSKVIQCIKSPSLIIKCILDILRSFSKNIIKIIKELCVFISNNKVIIIIVVCFLYLANEISSLSDRLYNEIRFLSEYSVSEIIEELYKTSHLIGIEKIEKIFSWLSDKLNYLFWGILISYGYFYIEISNYKKQIKELKKDKK